MQNNSAFAYFDFAMYNKNCVVQICNAGLIPTIFCAWTHIYVTGAKRPVSRDAVIAIRVVITRVFVITITARRCTRWSRRRCRWRWWWWWWWWWCRWWWRRWRWQVGDVAILWILRCWRCWWWQVVDVDIVLLLRRRRWLACHPGEVAFPWLLSWWGLLPWRTAVPLRFVPCRSIFCIIIVGNIAFWLGRARVVGMVGPFCCIASKGFCANPRGRPPIVVNLPTYNRIHCHIFTCSIKNYIWKVFKRYVLHRVRRHQKNSHAWHVKCDIHMPPSKNHMAHISRTPCSLSWLFADRTNPGEQYRDGRGLNWMFSLPDCENDILLVYKDGSWK